jgi:hypothetical protein
MTDLTIQEGPGEFIRKKVLRDDSPDLSTLDVGNINQDSS